MGSKVLAILMDRKRVGDECIAWFQNGNIFEMLYVDKKSVQNKLLGF